VCNIRDYLEKKIGVAPGVEAFFQQWIDQMARLLSVEEARIFEDREVARVQELQVAKYTSREWNYRK
jgi:lipoate-protein ligase A